MRADDILPDHENRADFAGVSVRKGTVAAFLQNARAFSATTTSQADRTTAEQDMIEALPALRALGLFDVLAVRDPSLAAFLAAVESSPGRG